MHGIPPKSPASPEALRIPANDESVRPVVTVIIPVFNAAAFIQPTIESVLAQSFQDFELIVVDDGSTDNTNEVVLSYGRRLKYVWKTNGGQSSARNAGITLARGSLIAFLDHDDIWYPEKLALQVEAILANPQLGLVTCGSVDFCEQGDLQTKIPHLPSQRRSVLANLLTGNHVGSCSKVLVRTECFRTLGVFDEHLCMAEDWEMWYRIALHYDIMVIPKPLIRYRIHKGNLSSRSGHLNFDNELAFLRRAFAEPLFRPGRLLRRRAIAERHMAAAIAFWEAGERQELVGSLLRAFTYLPTIAARRAFLGMAWSALFWHTGKSARDSTS